MCLCFHPSGRFLASGAGQPSEVKIWDLTRHQEYLNVRSVGAKRVVALVFSSDSQLVHTIRAAGALQATDAATGSERSSTTVDFTVKPIRPAVIAAFSSDAKQVATVSEVDTHVVNITSRDKNKLLHQLKHRGEVKNLALSKDG